MFDEEDEFEGRQRGGGLEAQGLQSFGDWKNATAATLEQLFAGDKQTMLDCFRMMMLGNIKRGTIEEACNSQKVKLDLANEWTEVPTVNAWPAYNETDQTVTQPVTLILSKSLETPAATSVAVVGQIHIVQEFWMGAPTYVLGAVGSRTMVPLPGSPGLFPGVPLLQTQIILGAGSQIEGGDWGTSAMYSGLYQMPSLQTPPPAVGNNLPPYTDPAWLGNKYLFVPGWITPVVVPSNAASNSSTYSSVLVSMASDWQPNTSIILPNFYDQGRMLSCRGIVQVNSSATGIVSTGSGTVGQVNTVAVGGVTQAWIKGQDRKSSETNQLSGTYTASSQGGLSFSQGPQIIRELQFIDYYLASGNAVGGKKLIADTLSLPASGISGTNTNGNIYQCTTPVQVGNAGPFIRNGVVDVQTGAFYAVRWYSPNWNIELSFAQNQSLASNQVQLGSATVPGLCNLYPQSIFSSDNCNSYSRAVRVAIDPLPQNLLPRFTCRWDYGMGMTSAGDVGYMVHVFMNLRSDGTAAYTSAFDGMGCIGKATSDPSNPYYAPFGIIPGGMRNTYFWTTQVQFPRTLQNGEPIIDTAWTWIGSLAFLNNFPNAIVEYSCEITVPQLYLSGAQLPAAWCMLESLQPGQNVQLVIGQTWQVVATAATRSTQLGISGLAHPPMSAGFAEFLRMVYKDQSLDFFSNSETMQTLYKKIGMVMQITTPREMFDFFAEMKVLRASSVMPMLLGHRQQTGEVSGAGGFMGMGKGMMRKIAEFVLPQAKQAAMQMVEAFAKDFARKRMREPAQIGWAPEQPSASGNVWAAGDDCNADGDVWGGGEVWGEGNMLGQTANSRPPIDSDDSDVEAAGGAFNRATKHLLLVGGSLNGWAGSGFQVPGAPWVGLNKFGLHARYEQGSDAMGNPVKQLVASHDMSKLLEAFSRQAGPQFRMMKLVDVFNLIKKNGPQEFEGISACITLEQKLEREVAGGDKLMRSLNLYLVDGQGNEKEITNAYWRGGRLPFNQGIVLYYPTPQSEPIPLSSATVRKIFKHRFEELKEWLKTEDQVRGNQPAPSRPASHDELKKAHTIAARSYRRLTKRIASSGREYGIDYPAATGIQILLMMIRRTEALIDAPYTGGRQFVEGAFTKAELENLAKKPKKLVSYLPNHGLSVAAIAALERAKPQAPAVLPQQPALPPIPGGSKANPFLVDDDNNPAVANPSNATNQAYLDRTGPFADVRPGGGDWWSDALQDKSYHQKLSDQGRIAAAARRRNTDPTQFFSNYNPEQLAQFARLLAEGQRQAQAIQQ